MIQKPTYLVIGAFLALFVLSGCNKQQDIQVYRVSKEAAAPDNGGMPPMGGPAGPSMAGAQGGSELTSATPAGWEPQPPSSMRLASFLVKGENGAVVDVSLVALGGGAGGVLENVNRWYSQLGQPAINADKLAQIAQHVPSMFGDVMLVDIEGLPQGGDPAKDGRILGGIIPGDDKTMFFKMRGNAALAEAQKGNFIKWIGSVRTEDAGSGAPAEAMPAAPGAPATEVPVADAGKPRIKWEVPDNWKTVPATSMRYASFAVAGQNGETADISISVFPGEAGGDFQNVNRWRGQIGLEPVEDIKPLVVPVTGKSGDISSVDMNGTKGRILAGWTRINGNTWFFKVTGPDQLTAGEKEKFVKFLQSIDFTQ